MTLKRNHNSHATTPSAASGAKCFAFVQRSFGQWLLLVTLVAVVFLLLLRESYDAATATAATTTPSSAAATTTAATTAAATSSAGLSGDGGSRRHATADASSSLSGTSDRDDGDRISDKSTDIRQRGEDDDESDEDAARRQQRDQPIRQISILGERNSGTRWTYDHISECFNHSIAVEKRLTRYKHWFQFEDSSRYPRDTLVLAQFRNPYDWLKAMEHVPHHSPAHLRTKLHASTNGTSAENDWRIFLTKPWTTERVGIDLTLDPDTTTCQDDFAYRDIVSCVLEPLPPSYYNYTIRYSEHQPFYEMRNDGSGLPYDNILELRTDKIRNFLSVANYPGVADAWVVQYEYLLAKGTDHLLRRIQEWTGIEPRCRSKPPQLHRRQKKSRIITKEFAQHVRQHLNWTVEQWIGYDIELKYEEEHDPNDYLSTTSY